MGEKLKHNEKIIRDIKIIDNSNKAGEFSTTFVFESGGEISYKFKDQRDALKFLTLNWELISPVESDTIFEYVNTGLGNRKFNQMQIYYFLILWIKLEFRWFFSMANPIPDIDETSSEEEVDLYTSINEIYIGELDRVTRMAHIFAVQNTWFFWSRDNGSNLKRLISDEEVFDVEFKGKKVVKVTGFNLEWRLWKVGFDDDSWVIASDAGNGWYWPETNFNSYKFI